MDTNVKPLIDSDQQRLASSQTGSTWFYLRHPKVTISWLLVIIGCAAYFAFRH